MRIPLLVVLAVMCGACAVERADDDGLVGDDQTVAGPTKGQLQMSLADYRGALGQFANLVNNPSHWVGPTGPVNGVYAEVFDDARLFGLPNAGNHGTIIARLWYVGTANNDPRYGMEPSTVSTGNPHLNKYYLIVGEDGRWQLFRLSGPPLQLADVPVKEGYFRPCTDDGTHSASEIQIGGSGKTCTLLAPDVAAPRQVLDSHDWVTCHGGCCSFHADA